MVTLASAGLAPETSRLEPNLLLIEDIGSRTLARADDPRVMASVAELARAIHRLPAPAEWIPLQQSWTDWRKHNPEHASFPNLPSHRARRARELLDGLTSGPAERSFLHGDLHHRNVFVQQGRLKVIDPHALVGDRAYDLAFFASRCQDPGLALEILLDAYGAPLPRMREWLEFCCLYTLSQLPLWGESAPCALKAMAG
jgi:streptomycin 6-kinase